MHRFRNLFFIGLVALLMAGIATADEVATSTSGDTVEFPIGAYLGTWMNNSCADTNDEVCVKLWVDFDLSILKLLF